MTASPSSPHITLACAAALTGLSLRTWQRRAEGGQVPRLDDASGRGLVPLQALMDALPPAWGDEDTQTLLDADQGGAAAQADMGARFAAAALVADNGADAARNARVALYFLARAADQCEADAMHWMGLLSAAGLDEAGGNPQQTQARALALVAQAAAQGHGIARGQLQALLANGLTAHG